MIEFDALPDKNVIVPIYPCGLRGPKVDVDLHGTNHAAWQLVDDYDKHAGPNGTNCKGCRVDTMVIGSVLNHIADEFTAASNQFNTLNKELTKDKK